MQVELNSSAVEVTVLVRGAGSEAAVPAEKGIRVVREARPEIAGRARNLFVLTSALDLPSVAKFVSIANRRHQLRALFVRVDVDERWLPQFFERAGLWIRFERCLNRNGEHRLLRPRRRASFDTEPRLRS